MLWRKFFLQSRAILLLAVPSLSIVCVMNFIRFQPLGGFDIGEWAARVARQENRFRAIGSEAVAQLSSFDGFVWAEWFREELLLFWPLFAILLGYRFAQEGDCRRTTSISYTLSLPVSRRRVIWVATGVAFVELVILALVPSLTLPIIAAVQGFDYGIGRVLEFVALLCGAGFFFYALSALFGQLFGNASVFVCIVIYYALWPFLPIDRFPAWHPFGVMSGEQLFLAGSVPWVGLLGYAAAAILLLVAHVRLAERLDL